MNSRQFIYSPLAIRTKQGKALEENYRQKPLDISGCHRPGEAASGSPDPHRLGKDSLSWKNGRNGAGQHGGGRGQRRHRDPPRDPPPPVPPKPENLLPPSAAAAQRKGWAGSGRAGPGRGRPRPAPEPGRARPTASAPRTRQPSGVGGGLAPEKAHAAGNGGGGGGIRNSVINKKPFRWADLWRCHVNKGEGAFPVPLLTLHILYTIHQYA